MKTAVSLDRELFERAEAAAGSLELTRSGLVALALSDFLRRHESRHLLDRLNDVYGQPEDDSERASREGMLAQLGGQLLVVHGQTT